MITTLARRDDTSSLSIDRDSQSFALFGHPVDDIDLTTAAIVEIGIDLIAAILSLQLPEDIAERDDIALVARIARLVRSKRIAQLRLRQGGRG